VAGYIFALGKNLPYENFLKCVKNGLFSTVISTLSNGPFEGTLADYSTMRPGDNIYFFFDRKIYGIGELKTIGIDCKFCNYLGSCKLESFAYEDIKSSLIIDNGPQSMNNRWLCTFIPSPYFFRKGIDMDDVLTYKPNTFKVLRTFWKISFIKIGEEENQSLKEIMLLRNQDALFLPNESNVLPFEDCIHKEIIHKLTDAHLIDMKELLSYCSSSGNIRHEMAIEAATLHRLSTDKKTLFGSWDYLSHQVPASPFKPIDYMDKIDIFACRFLDGTSIVSKYMVIEIKKNIADIDSVSQVVKYVDWICKEYAYGDYSIVEGYVLAFGFTTDAIEQKNNICERNYTRGSHPIENKVWNHVKLIKYYFDGDKIDFLTDEYK
jgi:hypothetical protein